MDIKLISLEGLEPAAKTASKLVEQLLKRPFEITGNMMADRLLFWQWTQRIRILEKTSKILKENDTAARALPPSFVFPLLDAAGNVEAEELQTLWSNLLASAVENEEACQVAYVEALRSLSSPEARLLLVVARQPVIFKLDKATREGFEKFNACHGIDFCELGFSGPDGFLSSLSRLSGIGCLLTETAGQSRLVANIEENGMEKRCQIGERRRIRVFLTRFGANLVAKCTREDPSSEVVIDSWVVFDNIRKIAVDAGGL